LKQQKETSQKIKENNTSDPVQSIYLQFQKRKLLIEQSENLILKYRHNRQERLGVASGSSLYIRKSRNSSLYSSPQISVPNSNNNNCVKKVQSLSNNQNPIKQIEEEEFSKNDNSKSSNLKEQEGKKITTSFENELKEQTLLNNDIDLHENEETENKTKIIETLSSTSSLTSHNKTDNREEVKIGKLAITFRERKRFSLEEMKFGSELLNETRKRKSLTPIWDVLQKSKLQDKNDSLEDLHLKVLKHEDNSPIDLNKINIGENLLDLEQKRIDNEGIEEYLKWEKELSSPEKLEKIETLNDGSGNKNLIDLFEVTNSLFGKHIPEKSSRESPLFACNFSSPCLSEESDENIRSESELSQTKKISTLLFEELCGSTNFEQTPIVRKKTDDMKKFEEHLPSDSNFQKLRTDFHKVSVSSEKVISAIEFEQSNQDLCQFKNENLQTQGKESLQQNKNCLEGSMPNTFQDFDLNYLQTKSKIKQEDNKKTIIHESNRNEKNINKELLKQNESKVLKTFILKEEIISLETVSQSENTKSTQNFQISQGEVLRNCSEAEENLFGKIAFQTDVHFYQKPIQNPHNEKLQSHIFVSLPQQKNKTFLNKSLDELTLEYSNQTENENQKKEKAEKKLFEVEKSLPSEKDERIETQMQDKNSILFKGSNDEKILENRNFEEDHPPEDATVNFEENIKQSYSREELTRTQNNNPLSEEKRNSFSESLVNKENRDKQILASPKQSSQTLNQNSPHSSINLTEKNIRNSNEPSFLLNLTQNEDWKLKDNTTVNGSKTTKFYNNLLIEKLDSESDFKIIEINKSGNVLQKENYSDICSSENKLNDLGNSQKNSLSNISQTNVNDQKSLENNSSENKIRKLSNGNKVLNLSNSGIENSNNELKKISDSKLLRNEDEKFFLDNKTKEIKTIKDNLESLESNVEGANNQLAVLPIQNHISNQNSLQKESSQNVKLLQNTFKHFKTRSFFSTRNLSMFAPIDEDIKSGKLIFSPELRSPNITAISSNTKSPKLEKNRSKHFFNEKAPNSPPKRKNKEDASNVTNVSSGEFSSKVSFSDFSFSPLRAPLGDDFSILHEKFSLTEIEGKSIDIPQEDFLNNLGNINFNETLILPSSQNNLSTEEDLNCYISTLFNENIGRVETFKKFGNVDACIQLLKELLQEIQKQEFLAQEIDVVVDNNKEGFSFSIKFYKIQVCNMLSLELFELQNYDEALLYTNIVVELDRYNIQALYKLYQIYIKLQKDKEAKSVLKKVRKLMQLNPISQSFKDIQLDKISIPSALSSSTNNSFYEGVSKLAYYQTPKASHEVGLSLSRFKSYQFSPKIENSSEVT